MQEKLENIIPWKKCSDFRLDIFKIFGRAIFEVAGPGQRTLEIGF